MIENAQQYEITAKWAARFQAVYDLVKAGSGSNVHPVILEAQLSSMASMIADLKAQMEEYERRIAHNN
jgi:hypothetical protein